jgi:omega-6 fatty acid desaturase (delta-12 desaturase)
MMSPTSRFDSPDGRSWSACLAPFRQPDCRRSIWQLSSTAILFGTTWLLMYHSLAVAYAITLLLAVPAAFLLVRLFIIQHDCAHGSFFESIRTADVIGSILGVLTLTPHLFWKRAHAIHHATAGNLDHRGVGDVETLTVNEYLGLTRWGRFKYRVYRHPCVLFGIGAVVLFLVKHRLPAIAPATWRRERRSILWTNVGIAAVVTLMGSLVGFNAFLLVHVPLTLIACSIGVWLFYVQHQFEPTYWERDERWVFDAAALEGSSYYALPRVLQWFTGSIGLHHIHHLSAGIPNYRLQGVLDAYPELGRATRITLWQSLSCASLALWDERTRTLVPFARVKAAR